MHRWIALGLVVLALPATTSAATVAIDAPAVAPADGTPFEAHVAIDGLPEGVHEVKLWLGGPGWQASRTWNGSAFERSDRYVLEVEANASGAWSGWVALEANTGSANHPRLVAQSEDEAAQGRERTVLGVRVRGPVGRLSHTLPVDVVAQPAHRWVGLGPGDTARALQGGELLARRTNLAGEPRVVELAVPAGFEGDTCTPPRCGPTDGLRLERAGTERAVVANPTNRSVPLAGSLIALPGAACPLTGTLARGGSLLVDPGASGAGELCHDRSEPGGPLRLVDRGVVVDEPPPRPGWGDRVRDGQPPHRWLPWRLPPGVEPDPIRWHAVDGHAHPFTTRGEGLEQVLDVIAGARERLTVTTYLLTNERVTSALASAATGGVDVTVLVEPSPVGGLPPQQEQLLDRLERSGVHIREVTDPHGGRGVQHAKVLVADGHVVLVLTENLTRSGLPADGDGNVGWGLGIANTTLARRVEERFDVEGGARPWTPDGWAPFEGRVAVLVSPENAWRRSGVPALVEDSDGPVDGLALRATPRWGPRPNPWLASMVNASTEHPVRVLLSGAPEPVRASNQDARGYLQAHPRVGDLEVRFSPPGQVVHAKALVGPDWVVVGSSNWGMGGAILNRELNLAVMDEELAGFYRDAFDHAWTDRGHGPERPAPLPGGLAAVPVVVALVLAQEERRRKGEDRS